MPATNQDFSMTAGDSLTLEFTITVPSKPVAPVDLTGVTSVIWSLANTVKSPVLLTKTLVTGIAVTDAPGGLLSVVLVPADTQSLIGKFYHEMQIIDAAGEVSTVAVGKATITPGLIP